MTLQYSVETRRVDGVGGNESRDGTYAVGPFAGYRRAQFRLCSRAASITTLRVNRLPLTAPQYRAAVQRKAADSEVPALRPAMAMVHVRINFAAGDMHASRGTQMKEKPAVSTFLSSL